MLYWLDLETTGLDPAIDRVLEIGMVVTDDDLNTLYVMPDMQIETSKQHLTMMSDFVRDMHTKSGLLDALADGAGIPIREAERKTIAFMQQVARDAPPPQRTLAGANVHFDRSFLRTNMGRLDPLFNYRHADTSSLREFAQRWAPDLKPGEALHPLQAHRPSLDLMDSINLARFYRDTIFKRSTQ